MDCLKVLLENHFIYKEADRELYYSIYDSQKEFQPFLNKLGFQLIVRNDFLRLEKFPAEVDEHMGFSGFESVEEYMLFMLLLIFLEDKPKEEQFLLADIVEFMEGNDIEIDTTKRKTRQHICRVLSFARDCYLIVCVGGNIDGYVSDAGVQVLYDNTGLSKYFMRNFPTELYKCNDLSDLLFLTQDTKTDITTSRRNAAYRNLLLCPAVYNSTQNADEYSYIRNYRSTIADDFERYLGWSLHVHKEMAMAIPAEDDRITNSFPGRDGLSSAVLLFNLEIRRLIDANILIPDKLGIIYMSHSEFTDISINVKKTKGMGLTQALRNMPDARFTEDLLTVLSKYMFARVVDSGIVLLPAIGKIAGDYPKNFYNAVSHNSEE